MGTNVTNQPQYLPSGDPENVDIPSPHPYPGMIGTKYTTGGKTYQLVGTDSSMTVSPFRGAVAWWSNKAIYSVTTSPTALGRGRVAGVFRTVAMTRGNYTYIQTKGQSTRVKFIDAVAAAPTVAGLFVIPSATAAKADTLAAGTAATYPTLGVTAGVYDAANAEATVDLDVPDTP